MKKILFNGILGCCLFLTACVKDTDFEQSEHITLSPIVEFDAVYFNLPAERFFDSSNSTQILTVTDTTKIKFLDGELLRENLRRVEFYFKFTNSIERSFQVDFQFLNQANDTTYVASTSVLPGRPHSAVVTEFFENIDGQDIQRLTQANKLAVLVTISDSEEDLVGTLNLKSKGTYYLEH